MPIEATVEGAMHRAGSAHIGGIVDNVIGLIWIFLLDALQRQAGEVRGFSLRQRKLILFDLLSEGNARKDRNYQQED